MRIKLTADSTIDLPKEILETHQISLSPKDIEIHKVNIHEVNNSRSVAGGQCCDVKAYGYRIVSCVFEMLV